VVKNNNIAMYVTTEKFNSKIIDKEIKSIRLSVIESNLVLREYCLIWNKTYIIGAYRNWMKQRPQIVIKSEMRNGAYLEIFSKNIIYKISTGINR